MLFFNMLTTWIDQNKNSMTSVTKELISVLVANISILQGANLKTVISLLTLITIYIEIASTGA